CRTGVALPRMVVARPQAAHWAVRDVRAVFLGDLVVALHDQNRLPAQPGKRLIEPIRKQPLHVVPVVLDRAGISTLALHVRIAIALPSLPERYRAWLDLWVFAGSLASGNGAKRFLSLPARLARRHVAKVAKLHLGRELANTITPELALRHEALAAFADEHEKSRQFAVADLVLLMSCELQARDALVGKNLTLISHGDFHRLSLGLVWGSPRRESSRSRYAMVA